MAKISQITLPNGTTYDLADKISTVSVTGSGNAVTTISKGTDGNITATKGSNFKTVQSAKSDPTASGTTITAIDTISQNANGEITATKKTIRDASASQSGVISTGSQTFAGVKTFNSQPVVPTPTADTSAANKKYVDDAIGRVGTPMQFKGTVGTGGTIEWSALPAAGADNNGWMYKAISAHATAPICKEGDLICSNGTEWVVLPAGDDVKAVNTGTWLVGGPITSTGTISHATGGANGTFGPSEDKAPGYGGTFTVPQVTVDTYGHTTFGANRTITMPSAQTIGNGTLTIKQNGTSKGTFTANQSGNTTIELTDYNTDTIPSAYCSTAAGTAAKVASCTNYALLSNTYTHVLISTANTAASALTLNINGKGAKPIYINGTASSSSNYTLPAGTYIVFYNGTNYYFRTDGTIPGKTENTAGITRALHGGGFYKTTVSDGYIDASSTVETKISSSNGLYLTGGISTNISTTNGNINLSAQDIKVNNESLHVTKVATGTIAVGSKTVTVSFTGTYLSSYIVDANGKKTLADETIGASSVVFELQDNATAALTCKVIYM